MKHAVLIPWPTAGHINPLLKLARILHSRGFYITFFISEQVRKLQLAAAAAQPNEPHLPPPSLHPFQGFRLEIVSDGLPPSCSSGPEYLRELTAAVGTTYVDEVRTRLSQLADEVPPVTCVIAGLLGPALRIAEELGVAGFMFWTTSACGFLPTLHAEELIARGYVAPQGKPPDGSCINVSDHLNKVVDWIPGLRALRVKDMSSNFSIKNPDDVLLKFDCEASLWASRASGGVILNTCDALEYEAIEAMRIHFKRLYVLGPLSIVLDDLREGIPIVEMSFWRDERRYFSWLDTQEVGSVPYINFGSIVTMDFEQLSELVLGVVSSGVPFLWIVRPDIMDASSTNNDLEIQSKVLNLLPDHCKEVVNNRGFFVDWCSQEEVLAHPALGGFLTHAGWNSMSESIGRGVPMICKPFIYDQTVNCRYACDEWGVAMDLEEKVTSHDVEGLIREVILGSKGKILRKNADKWKKIVFENAMKGGPSQRDLEALVNSCSMSIKST